MAFVAYCILHSVCWSVFVQVAYGFVVETTPQHSKLILHSRTLPYSSDVQPVSFNENVCGCAQVLGKH